ncbi:ABC transporter, phosphonate, periplasmic substrate-binding protein [uncultured archaeon]|nr:ABC transporter, phosphonate, periplasmic substrate-binding protein [uncultured archaeon]
MCDILMPAVYKIAVLQPHADSGWFGPIQDAAALATYIGVLFVALLLFYWLRGQEMIPESKIEQWRSERRCARNIAPIFFLVFIIAIGMALGQSPFELKVIGPTDNILEGTIKEISQSFSDANKIPVNITLVRGREMVVKSVMKNESMADVVILEKDYPLFNLSGMKKLEKKKRIYEYAYLYSERALMIFRKSDPISSLDDLSKMRVAVTDQHVPGACLARKIIEREGLDVSEVNASSNEAQLDAVIGGRADATILWEGMFETYRNSTEKGIEILDLPEYRMDNFIAVLKDAQNPAEAEMYVNFLIKSLASGNYDSQGTLKAAA